MRYWLRDHLIRREAARRGAPLSVLEVGVDSGQMLAFMKGAEPSADPSADTPARLPRQIASWDAVTLLPDVPRLLSLGYTRVWEQDVESPDYRLPPNYDVIIVLHVMEHLYEPEAALCRLAAGLRAGGIVIGGFPTLPEPFRQLREWQLRRRPSRRRHGHVSKHSPRRTRAMARLAGIELEWLTGAFMRRRNGCVLENLRWWTRFNLMFGAVFPWWPGETYWQMRRRDERRVT